MSKTAGMLQFPQPLYNRLRQITIKHNFSVTNLDAVNTEID